MSAEGSAATVSRRHLMQLQMMHQNLKVMALEAKVAEDHTALSCTQRRAQDGATLEVSLREMMELQSRIKHLQAQLDQEKYERESLQMELDRSARRSADKDELCESSHSEELFHQVLDKIVDECVRQKRAHKTVQSVANLWLGLVRNKQTDNMEDEQPATGRSKTQELAQKAEELNQAKDEITKAKALQEAFLVEFDGEVMTMRCELAQKEEELKQARLEIARTKALQEAAIEEFDAEVMAMRSRINQLQQQLEEATANNQAGSASVQDQIITDLKQQLDRERDARLALQKELSLVQVNAAMDADIKTLREQIELEKNACDMLERNLDTSAGQSVVNTTLPRDVKNQIDGSTKAVLDDVANHEPKVDDSILPRVAPGPHNPSCCSPASRLTVAPPIIISSGAYPTSPSFSPHTCDRRAFAKAAVQPSTRVVTRSVSPTRVVPRAPQHPDVAGLAPQLPPQALVRHGKQNNLVPSVDVGKSPKTRSAYLI